MKDFLGSFAEGIGNLTRAYLFPAVVAVALWDYFVVEVAKSEPESIYADLRAISGSSEILVLAGAALTVALVLGIVTPTTTRWLEGYWWGRQQVRGPLQWLWNRRVQGHHQERRTHIRAINALMERADDLSPGEKAKLSRHQARLSRYPKFPAPTMPTRLGNVLRAGEQFGATRYGLDAIILWDPLLASVPDALATTQSNRRTNLDLFVSTAVLPPLFVAATLHAVVTTPVSWGRLGVIAAVGLAVCVGSYFAAVEAAKSYADSIAAIVQLGRQPLAEALRLTLPSKVDEEKRLWLAIGGFTFWGEAAARNEGWVTTIELARTAPRGGGPPALVRDLESLAHLHDRGLLTAVQFETALSQMFSENE